MQFPEIDTYSIQMIEGAGMPHVLSSIQDNMSAHYGYLVMKLPRYKFIWSEFYKKNCRDENGKKVSDKMIEAEWLCSEEGQKHYTTKKKIEALKMMISSCNSSVFTANAEARNTQ